MPRKKYKKKFELKPDPMCGNLTVAKFINNLMYGGKKSTAEGIVYGSFKIIEERTGQTGLAIFKMALTNAKPVVEVKSRRVGGATYQVPVEVRPERRTSLAMRWIIGFAKARSEKSMEERLAAELIAASKREGNTIKKREDTHRMAEANKAFAHYRW
ncbi:MAG: 30S ribosomal protein S7 [Gemmatimonadetes bacterium]|nr:30S ribosomal protein S7 [Gemmatimonadota bacterium]